MRINRFLSKLSDIFKRVGLAKKTLYRYSDLLLSGRYKLNPNLTMIYELNSAEKARVEGNYQYDNIDGNRIKTWDYYVRRFLTKFTYKLPKTNNNIFQGQLLSFTSMQNGIKVFDFKNKKIISVFLDESFFDKIVKARNYWSSYFNVPPFAIIKGKYNIIEEEILQKEEYDREEMLLSILDDYEKYLSEIEISEISFVDEEKLGKFSKLLEVEVEGLRNYMISSEYRECIVHGDIWYANILYDGENKYYIDFENVGKRVFYYDILLYIFIDWQLDNSALIEKFLKGDLDSRVEKLYNCINIKYDRSKKREMFLAFLYFYYLEYWQDKESVGDKLKELLTSFNKN